MRRNCGTYTQGNRRRRLRSGQLPYLGFFFFSCLGSRALLLRVLFLCAVFSGMRRKRKTVSLGLLASRNLTMVRKFFRFTVGSRHVIVNG